LTNLETAVEAMKNVPWTELQKMKGNAGLLEKIDDAEELLRSLRKALKSA
jgi:ParB family transcriptional regulator, chromosome partitioning protein